MDRQIYARMAAHEDRHWWFVARRRILERVLRRFVTLPERAEILEAGCGTGGNLPLLARFGRVHAVEPDAEARALARAKGGPPADDPGADVSGPDDSGDRFDVRAGDLPDGLPFQDGRFDLVAAFDVLEHVERDGDSLAALCGRMKPDGWLLLTVPAFPFLWSRHDELHHHKRRYRRAELLARVRRAGLEPVLASYFNTLLFPAIAALRLLRRALGGAGLDRDGSDDERLPAPPLNRLLAGLFALERHLIGRVPLPFGVSLLVLARRARA